MEWGCARGDATSCSGSNIRDASVVVRRCGCGMSKKRSHMSVTHSYIIRSGISRDVKWLSSVTCGVCGVVRGSAVDRGFVRGRKCSFRCATLGNYTHALRFVETMANAPRPVALTFLFFSFSCLNNFMFSSVLVVSLLFSSVKLHLLHSSVSLPLLLSIFLLSSSSFPQQYCCCYFVLCLLFPIVFWLCR